MDEQQEHREWARELFKEHPEADLLATGGVLKVLGRHGIEPTPELVSYLALNAVAKMRADYLARVEEVVTDEDIDQILREEAARLIDPDTRLINRDALDAAANQRIKERVRGFFPGLIGNE